MNRREFVVILTCAVAAGCASRHESENGPVRLVPASLDAGPTTDYAVDGVYDNFRHQGFFVVRQGDKLLALSAFCTHRTCPLKAEPDRTFYCKCHGSTFDPAGKVTQGPATADLPVLSTSIDERGHLIILSLASSTP